MVGASRGRLALFLVASALLLGSAAVLSAGGSYSEPPSPAPSSRSLVGMSAWARRVEARVRASAAHLRGAARPFLVAFARYEVGDLTLRVRSDLRERSTPRFATELLARPPRRSAVGNFVGRARIERLDVRFVAADAARALVSGTLRRAALPEEFAFLFVRRDGLWLASGPGE